jgi:hypothetical protein
LISLTIDGSSLGVKPQSEALFTQSTVVKVWQYRDFDKMYRMYASFVVIISTPESIFIVLSIIALNYSIFKELEKVVKKL